MRGRKIAGIIAFVLWGMQVLPPSAAQAASISSSTSQYCNIALSGPITKGDSAKLANALKNIPPRKARTPRGVSSGGTSAWDEHERTDICLNSSGGDFAETLQIVNMLVGEKGNWETVGTVVDNGAECIAECAFIFMAGKRHEFHGISFPLRQMHVGAKLGFRLPQTATPSGNVSQKDLALAYSAAVRQVRTLMESNAKVDLLEKFKPFPKTLTAKVLTLDDNETMTVDSIEQLGAWSIQPIGLPRPSALSNTVSDASLYRACSNYGRWYYAAKPAPNSTASQTPVTLKSLKSDRYYTTVFKGFGAQSDGYCIVFYFDTRVNGPKLDIGVYKSLKPQKDEYRSTPDSIQEYFAGADPFDSIGVPVWYMFDPAAKLEQLPALMK